MEGNLERIATIAQVGGPAPGLAPAEIQQGRDVRRPVSAQIRQGKAPRPSTGVDPAKPLVMPAEWRVAASLALIAGYVDAYGFAALGVYVSFMSGNTTQAGAQTGQGHFAAALPSALAVMFFVIGNFAGALFTHSGLRRSRRALLGAVAALLAVIMGIANSVPLNAEVGIAVIALAMGMMNTTLSQVGGETVSLTFVTGDLARIARHLAMAIIRAPVQGAQGSWDTHLHRAFIVTRVWGGFLTGALLSGAAIPHFGVWVLLLPFMILLVLAVHSGAGDKLARHQSSRDPA
jgi:uncharacterized membrane protein YoaK (UPF0700 family)